MTVAPFCFDVSPNYETVFHVIKTCHQIACRQKSVQVASVYIDLPIVDPLTVLLTLASEQRWQFYLESSERSEAIAAWDQLWEASFSGSDRFQKVQKRLAEWAACIHKWTDQFQSKTDSEGGPYFFNTFTFFDGVSSTAPFAPATIVLPRWQIVRRQQQCRLIANFLVEPKTSPETLLRELWQQVKQIVQTRSSRGMVTMPIRKHDQNLSLSTAEELAFKHSVEQALLAIEQGRLRKQVVAQALNVFAIRPNQRAISLQYLRARHLDCHIFAVGNGQGAHFIGASPERLLSIRQGRLVTDALAGSAPRGAHAREDQSLGQLLLNNPKEQQEHRLVVEFIVRQLRQKGLRPRYNALPGLLRLSHIQHLHTLICADVSADCSPLDLVEMLHPTPAVAGVPADVACQYIRQGEGCDRGLYAAPFGWVDAQGNSEFVVGIRSALLQGDRARLYAGAGIVSGSDPQRELAEIQLKLRALAEALG